MSDIYDYIVIGAGIAGLTYAYRNKSNNFIILEKNLKDRELCLWIDETNSQVVVTFRVVAEEQKRPIFPLRGK